MDRGSLLKVLVSVAVLVVLSLIMPVLSAVFVAGLLALVLFGVDSKVPYLISLSLLVLAALFIALNSNGAAEFFAVWSFYFLALGLLAQFRDGIGRGAYEDEEIYRGQPWPGWSALGNMVLHLRDIIEEPPRHR